MKRHSLSIYFVVFFVLIIPFWLFTGCNPSSAATPISSLLTQSASSSFSGTVSSSSSAANSRLFPYTETRSDGSVFVFSSDSIGWETKWWVNSKTPDIYETLNGGETWEPAQVSLCPEMLEGLSAFHTFPIAWIDDHWQFSLKARKEVGYPDSCFYDFSLDVSTNIWIWNDPEWNLPDDVNVIHFMDFVQWYTAEAPAIYTQQEGLSDAACVFWLIQDTAAFYQRLGETLPTENNRLIVPYEWVNQMALYLYGDTSFDASSFVTESSSEKNSLPGTENGFYLTSPTWRTEGYETLAIHASTANDGTISAIVATFFFDGGGSAWVPAPSDTMYQACVFRPIQVEGIPLFTLLSSEIIDRPAWYNGTPGSHYQ